MEGDSIGRIREATFPIARRGYDKREVDRFLARLADWLESGGADQARIEVVRRDLERIGRRTAAILTEAYTAAEALRADAERGAEKAASEADRIVAEAEAKAERVIAEVTRRRLEIEAGLSDLIERREAVLAEIKQLTGRLGSSVDRERPGADHTADEIASGPGDRPR